MTLMTPSKIRFVKNQHDRAEQFAVGAVTMEIE